MEALWLVHNGVPFDVAFQMPDVDRFAMCIVFSGFQGAKFDWDRMRFEDPK